MNDANCRRKYQHVFPARRKLRKRGYLRVIWLDTQPDILARRYDRVLRLVMQAWRNV